MGVKSYERDQNITARIRLTLLKENVFYVNMHKEKKMFSSTVKGECEYSTGLPETYVYIKKLLKSCSS